MTLQLILVKGIHAEMERNAKRYNKVDSSAVVKKDGREHSVTKILTTAPNNHVPLEQAVLILSMTSDATVQMVLLEKDVKRKLICVERSLAIMVSVWTNSSVTNAFVLLAGKVICAMLI